MPLIDNIRTAMSGGGTLDLQIDVALNQRPAGQLQVYLHAIPNGVRIDQTLPGEQANILWLPWRQGTLQVLRNTSISAAPVGTVFLTYYLTGCKIFAIRGGHVWHIDAPVSVTEFWPQITSDEWVEDNWPTGTSQNVAYIRRAGQQPPLWDLSAVLQGAQPTSYGNGNVGQALVGGVVNSSRQLDLYYKASPWARLGYAAQRRKKQASRRR